MLSAMNSRRATVNKILTFSCVDGPGNRLVVFMQGCNFDCPGCHNPYTIGICNNCADCVSICHAGALSLRDGKIVLAQEACDQCDDCLRACPISASPMTREYTVAEIIDIARANRPFLNGITVSGGEATLHRGFVTDLFSAIKTDAKLTGLTCFLDTNGHLEARFWEPLLAVTDGVMLDIKAASRPTHRALTGRDNRNVLRSAKLLHGTGKLHEIRLLMIPGMSACTRELKKIADFIISLDPGIRVRLNAFQLHGVRGEATTWPPMSKDGINKAKHLLLAAGLKTVITPAIYQ